MFISSPFLIVKADLGSTSSKDQLQGARPALIRQDEFMRVVLVDSM